jgi:hypothetical protein
MRNAKFEIRNCEDFTEVALKFGVSHFAFRIFLLSAQTLRWLRSLRMKAFKIPLESSLY